MQSRQHYLILGIFVVVSLLTSNPAATVSASSPVKRNKCVQLHEEYDLRNLARDNNVFLIVQEPDSSEDRETICGRLESTPKERMDNSDVAFAYMELKGGWEDDDGNWNEGTRGFSASSLGAKSFPAFIYISKGMDGKSKYSDHVKTRYTGSVDNLEMSDMDKFIEKQIGYRIGNDVYNIIFFDSIVSRFVSYGNAQGLDKLKQRGLALLVRVSTLFSFKEPFTSIGKLYNRAFAMSFEHGMMYCGKQAEKLQKKLEKNESNLTMEKKHEFQQKIAILKSFSEPKVVTSEEDRQIIIHAALHVALIVATLLLFFLPGGGEEETTDEEESEEKVLNAVPVEAKEVVDEKAYKKND